jgi:hypothetical protein
MITSTWRYPLSGIHPDDADGNSHLQSGHDSGD